MNGPGDIPLTLSSTPDTKPCSLISIIPTLGMSSCRGRAEAFARSLSSKLRTLGSQTDDDPISQEDEPIINGSATNTWITAHESEQTVTDLQPLRHEADSFFDFECELESPGSPVDECEYLRLIETASNTPHNSAAESGYVCASAASSHSSTDGQYFDSVAEQQTQQKQQQPTRRTPSPSAISEQRQHEHQTFKNIKNETILRLSNGLTDGDDEDDGHDHEYVHDVLENDNESSEQRHDIKSKENIQSNNTTEKSLPTSGSDIEVSTLSPQNAKPEEQLNKELSDQEMVRMQHDIISELQKQSEDLSDTTTINVTTTSTCSLDDSQISKSVTESERETRKEVPKESNISNTSETNVVHTIITNGHLENGEEVLKIEVTEIEKQQTETSLSEVLLPKEDSTDKDKQLNVETTSNKETTTNVESKNTTEKKTTKESSQLSGLDTTDDEDECRPQRLRRCSSLKTGKTPPGTPGRKKIVRFADVLGLDLADVKTFLDEVPTIPKSAFEDLEIMESEPPIQLGPKSDKLLMPLFQQPGGLPTFLDIVREKQVSLENAAVTDHINQTITGSVRVRNLDFHKSVHIRYSIDGWRSFADLQANYVDNSCDGFSDKFSFVIFCNSMHIGQRLEIAVRFQCKGQQFWDNNYGANYCFQCLPTSTPVTAPLQPITTTHQTSHMMGGMLSPTVGEAWCSSFY